MLGYDEVIKLGYTDGKEIGTIIVNVHGITLRLVVGTKMGSLDGSFDVSNDGNLKGLLNVESMGFTDGKVLGSDEGIKLGLSGGKVLGTILGNVDEITLGINVGTELGSVNGYIDSSNDGSLIIKPTLEHLGMACIFLGYEQNHMDGTYRMLN